MPSAAVDVKKLHHVLAAEDVFEFGVVRLLAFHEVDRLFEVFGLDLVIGLRDEADRHC